MLQGKDNVIMNNYGNGFTPTGTNSRGVAIPIPNQLTRKSHDVRHVPSSEFFSSSDESSSGSTSPESPTMDSGYVPLSSSHHGGFSSYQGNHPSSTGQLPLNVYGTSPRTSVMFNYYNSPKGIYQRPHHPLIRTKSTDTPPTCNISHGHIDFSEANSSRNSTNENSVAHKKAKTPAGMSAHHYQQLDDSRPRAWSESDKHRSGSIHNSRMSALRKLKMKLGQKGGLKRQKSREEDDRNRSGASITSLEKVEEGRQLDCITSPKQNTSFHEHSTSPKSISALYQEHETRKRNERRPGVVRNPIATSQGHLPKVQENPENFLVYQRFLEEHSCYDLMPTSSKLVILDTNLQVRKAFHALVENSLRCAPLWDSETNDYVGVLTVSDFINILLAYHSCPNKKLEDLENQKISCWRQVLNSKKTLIQLPPESSIFDALKTLTEKNIRRLAIVNPQDGDIYHVINHRRILHFLFLFMNELPKPPYVFKTVKELGLGTRADVSVISEESPVIEALKLISEHKISGLPVIDSLGHVTDVFTKTDVLVLAGEKLFYDLSIKVKDVISLHSSVDLNEKKPTVVRTMPGSPALVRRKNQPKQSQNHPQSSTPVTVMSNHPFLRNAPSPLVTSAGGTTGFTSSTPDPHSKEKYYRHSTGQQADKPHGYGKGDQPHILSPPNAQPLLHRRRHLSSHLPRSSSISTHLVTVTMDDTLECVVNSVVSADVPQAVIVDEWDNVKGVISVGDILRFMVYPTKDGMVMKNEDGSVILDQQRVNESSPNKFLAVGQPHRARAISDDSDFQSASHAQFSADIVKVPNWSMSPPNPTAPKLPTGISQDSGCTSSLKAASRSKGSSDSSREPLLSSTESNGAGDDFDATLSDFSSISLSVTVPKNAQSNPLQNQPAPQAHILASGEEIKRL